MRNVRKERNIPKEWRTGIITLLYKRGEQEKVKNYSGISLLCSAYKIYTEILKKKLEKEVEGKDLLSESQALEKIDPRDLCILNHIV